MQGLEYSSESLYSRAIMLRKKKKINIYVEDTNKEYEYETIFKRLLGEDDYSNLINDIIGLGGKQKVKEYYQDNGPMTEKAYNFYLVDGDFDRYIKSETMIQDSCFLYLETYNIENYLIDEKACECYSKSRLKCFDKEVHEKINFNYWKDSLVGQIYPLFFCFCLSQQEHLKEPTVSQSPGKFINYKTGIDVRDEEIQNYKQHIFENIDEPNKKLVSIKERYEQINGNDYFNLICGKFLFKCLCFYLANIIGDFKHEDLRGYLISHFDIEKLSYVRQAIFEVKNSKNTIFYK